MKTKEPNILRLIYVGTSFVVHAVIVILLFGKYGLISIASLAIPVMVGAYYYGQIGGIFSAILITLVNLMLLPAIGVDPASDYINVSLVAGFASMFSGFVAGRMRKMSDTTRVLEEDVVSLRFGLDKSSDIIFITDYDGKFRYVNDSFKKIYKYEEKDWKGMTPRILKSGLKDKKFYMDFWKRIKSGENVQVLMHNKTKDGKILDIEASVNPIKDSFGKITGFLAIQRDVTDKLKNEQELKIRAEELEKINELMVGRELRMIELKKKIKEGK